MNTERLLQLAQTMLRAERDYGLQGLVDNLRSHLDVLASNPGDQGAQGATADILNTLSRAMGLFEATLTPAQTEALVELGAQPFYSSALPGGIRAHLAESAIVASTVRDRVAQLQGERAEYLQRIDELRRGLQAVGVSELPMAPGVEAGFLIPRALFSNTLDGFGNELEQIAKIVAVFSELATGSVEPLELRQISTTDPLVIVALATPVALAFGKAVDWLLETVRKVLELKNLYEQSKKSEFPDSLLEQIKDHINSTVKSQIDARAGELASTYVGAAEGRANELENHLKFALSQMFAKIERGMTVELRLIPPPLADGEADADAAAHIADYEALDQISKRLEFPKLSGEPLLKLDDKTNSDD